MTIKLGVVMDPIESIHYKKDTTLAMLWEAERRGWEIYYFEMSDLFLRDGVSYGHARPLHVFADQAAWFKLGVAKTMPLAALDVILMRKDPPFDLNYLYATQLLDRAEREGVWVINKPQALRDANEKLYAGWFKECCPPTLVTQCMSDIRQFLQEHGKIICKPLHAMGGQSIFYLHEADINVSVIIEMLTKNNSQFIMAQRFIPEVVAGDKRIILINGEPVPYALVRIPAKGELRGNLAAGAAGVAMPLTDRDQWICQQIGPTLREKGLYFVGIDVIGDYLTEINVTSPTCVREIDEQCNTNISASFFDFILTRCTAK